MDAKKTTKANLEKKRGLFFQIGVVLVLCLVIYSFEWNTGNMVSVLTIKDPIETADEDPMPFTIQEKLTPPEPKKITLPEILLIIDTQDDLGEDELDVENLNEDNWEDYVEHVELEEETEEIFEPPFLSEQPMFPGGDEALLLYIKNNTDYPVLARELGIEGKVYVGFVIDKKGNVTNVHLLRGRDPLLDAEAMRVVGSLPRFKPGKNKNIPVSVNFRVPINFKLSK